MPEDMPLSGWSRPTGLLNYPDCSPEGLGIPDLGEVNVTFPDTKTRELRRAYYATISFMDHQVGIIMIIVMIMMMMMGRLGGCWTRWRSWAWPPAPPSCSWVTTGCT